MKRIIALLLLLLAPWLGTTTLAAAEPDAQGASGKVSALLDNLKPSGDEQLYIQANPGPSSLDYRLQQEENRFYLIVMITLVTPVILMILLHYVRSSRSFTDQAIMHTSGLVLVIQATTVVVLASTTTEQLSTAIGVLAAIAGYLFGAARNRKEDSKPGSE